MSNVLRRNAAQLQEREKRKEFARVEQAINSVVQHQYTVRQKLDEALEEYYFRVDHETSIDRVPPLGTLLRNLFVIGVLFLPAWYLNSPSLAAVLLPAAALANYVLIACCFLQWLGRFMTWKSRTVAFLVLEAISVLIFPVALGVCVDLWFYSLASVTDVEMHGYTHSYGWLWWVQATVALFLTGIVGSAWYHTDDLRPDDTAPPVLVYPEVPDR